MSRHSHLMNLNSTIMLSIVSDKYDIEFSMEIKVINTNNLQALLIQLFTKCSFLSYQCQHDLPVELHIVGHDVEQPVYL